MTVYRQESISDKFLTTVYSPYTVHFRNSLVHCTVGKSFTVHSVCGNVDT